MRQKAPGLPLILVALASLEIQLTGDPRKPL
jgi:hypothetical protein